MIKFIIILYLLLINIAFSNLVINEIMPAPNSPEPEWIELYNFGIDSLFKDTLMISDPTKTAKIYNFTLKSNEYCLITSDTNKLKNARQIPDAIKLYQVTLPTFNNTNDFCKIFAGNTIIDSLYYDMNWGINGKSFERIKPELQVNDGQNLMVSNDESGASAGRINSYIEEKFNNKTYFKINEIMFDVSSDNAEYIEIWNYSSDTANLKNCKFTDATNKGFTINSDIYVNPKSYFILYWDTLIYNKFPFLKDSSNKFYSNEKISLNNDEDIVSIRNYIDSLIDSVSYNYKWHDSNLDYTKDVSLEKISENLESNLPNSWSSSTNILGGSPAAKNSYDDTSDSLSNLKIIPNPFSISKSGELITIEFQTPFASSKTNIRIFDINGFLVSHPINNQFLGKSPKLDINPIDKNNNKLTPAPYIIQIESADTISGTLYEQKALFVIAK